MCRLSNGFGNFHGWHSNFRTNLIVFFSVFAFYFLCWQKLQNADLIGFAFLMIAATVNTSGIFVYCYFGKMASDSYKSMSESIFESNWQKMPIGLQKYLILMIGNTQKPQFYHGFGVFVLSLETFAAVSMFRLESINVSFLVWKLEIIIIILNEYQSNNFYRFL